MDNMPIIMIVIDGEVYSLIQYLSYNCYQVLRAGGPMCNLWFVTIEVGSTVYLEGANTSFKKCTVDGILIDVPDITKIVYNYLKQKLSGSVCIRFDYAPKGDLIQVKSINLNSKGMHAVTKNWSIQLVGTFPVTIERINNDIDTVM